jgi:hypothetical protein
MTDNNAQDFPKNFWEALYGRPLDKAELDEMQGNAVAFIKLMTEERLISKRRELQLEIFRIDRELENISISTPLTTGDLLQKFDVASAFMLRNRPSD